MSGYYTRLHSRRLRDYAADLLRSSLTATDEEAAAVLRGFAARSIDEADQLDAGEIEEEVARKQFIDKFYGSRVYHVAESRAIEYSKGLVAMLRRAGNTIPADVDDELQQQTIFLFCEVLSAAVTLFGEERVVVDDEGVRRLRDAGA